MNHQDAHGDEGKAYIRAQGAAFRHHRTAVPHHSTTRKEAQGPNTRLSSPLVPLPSPLPRWLDFLPCPSSAADRTCHADHQIRERQKGIDRRKQPTYSTTSTTTTTTATTTTTTTTTSTTT
ncbi:hypothetical protein E2C01_002585 [Portunus trituberculatus]|uniref:Uncharacterized protein n=1 Tax=Portunus trituberculatus TaxID=210409 RepID=A0A5B7CMK5_PORTR|nr:hypothetical protein [Portunus trituberculatus]